MPASYRIDKDRRRVVTVGQGPIGWDDIIWHMDDLTKNPDFDPTFSQLLDFSRVTEVNLSHDQIFELAKRTVFSKGSKRAFVTANKAHYGLSRMFQSYRKMFGAETIHVFTSFAEAEGWLNRREEPDEHAHARGSTA